jgi:hypothetical protein
VANPNNAWKYRGPRIKADQRDVNFCNEDEVRAEMTAKYPKPEYEVRKVRARRGMKIIDTMVAFKN